MKANTGNQQFITLGLKFSDSKIPIFKKVNTKDWMQFGGEELGEYKDRYPDYLLMLFNKSAKHNAIINGKVNYIFGKGLKTTDPATEQWAAKVNSASESANDISRKAILDIETYGGFYLQMIFNMAGSLQDIFHVEFKNMRANEDGTKFYYKKNFDGKKDEIKEYPAFDLKVPQTSIFFFGEYRPGTKNYCLPSYVGSSNYIEADVEVSKHTLTNAKTGFSASKFVNFYNGEPDEDKKRAIERRFNEKFTGSEGKKLLIGFNNDITKRPTIDDLGASDITKEDFAHIDTLIANNIYAGHQITSPMLFGIKESGQLGGHNELRIAYEIFKNTYAENKQKQFERVINQIANFKGLAGGLNFIQTDPVGIEFSDQVILQAAPRSWVLEKMGVDSKVYTDDPVGARNPDVNKLPPATQPNAEGDDQPAAMVNDNIKNLSAKQHQQLMRIIRQFTKGQLNKVQATTLIKTSLGLSDDEINSLLGVDKNGFSTDYSEEDVADMFEEIGQSRQGFEVIDSKKVQFSSDKEVLEYEAGFFQKLSFDDETTTDKVGNEITDASVINEVRKKIADAKKLTRKLPNISIKYSYEVQPGAGAAVIATTRPFCRKMIQLDRLYSRQEIESISERLGYSVWNRRGGFWNNNGTIEPHCRHLWKSNIVVKK